MTPTTAAAAAIGAAVAAEVTGQQVEPVQLENMREKAKSLNVLTFWGYFTFLYVCFINQSLACLLLQ